MSRSCTTTDGDTPGSGAGIRAQRLCDTLQPALLDEASRVLHGVVSGWGDADSLRFGHAAGCLKHAVPGDFNLVDAEDVMALVRGERLDVKR